MNSTSARQRRRPKSRVVSDAVALLGVVAVFAAFAWDPASAVTQVATTPAVRQPQIVPTVLDSSASAASLEVIASWEASAGQGSGLF